MNAAIKTTYNYGLSLLRPSAKELEPELKRQKDLEEGVIGADISVPAATVDMEEGIAAAELMPVQEEGEMTGEIKSLPGGDPFGDETGAGIKYKTLTWL